MRTRIDLVRLLEASGIGYETVESGRCWMIVAPALAARIMGAGIGDENAFWVPPAISARGWSDGGNAGGQRTWIAPESGPSGFFVTPDGARWDVPLELDPGAYRESPAPTGWKKYQMTFGARSVDRLSRHITLARSMSIEEHVSSTGTVMHIRFQHELGNAGPAALDRTIGLWSIIQLPCDERVDGRFAWLSYDSLLTFCRPRIHRRSLEIEGTVSWFGIDSIERDVFLEVVSFQIFLDHRQLADMERFVLLYSRAVKDAEAAGNAAP